jgi:hypothetical protein
VIQFGGGDARLRCGGLTRGGEGGEIFKLARGEEGWTKGWKSRNATPALRPKRDLKSRLFWCAASFPRDLQKRFFHRRECRGFYDARTTLSVFFPPQAGKLLSHPS